MKNLVKVKCIKERKTAFGGNMGDIYNLDKSTVFNMSGETFGEIYAENGSFVGLFNLERFVEI